ncbi:hypothetical protein AX16_007369 [Volvariella volvacea WC 439]|nr:hypothetical protein AX16_007369 [Volvariella volvacea WC 439]
MLKVIIIINLSLPHFLESTTESSTEPSPTVKFSNSSSNEVLLPREAQASFSQVHGIEDNEDTMEKDNNTVPLHSDLVPIYQSTPRLDSLDYGTLVSKPEFDEGVKKCILAGLAFKTSGCYVNMAHLPSNTVERARVQVNLSGTTKPAIGIILGIVQRQVTILPFQHELPLIAAGWANAVGMEQLVISFSNGIYQGLNLTFRRSWPKSSNSAVSTALNKAFQANARSSHYTSPFLSAKAKAQSFQRRAKGKAPAGVYNMAREFAETGNYLFMMAGPQRAIFLPSQMSSCLTGVQALLLGQWG